MSHTRLSVDHLQTDVSIGDYANSSSQRGRVSKQLVGRQLKNWFECELHEFEEGFDSESSGEEQEDDKEDVDPETSPDLVSTNPLKLKRKRAKKKQPKRTDSTDDDVIGVIYPNDLWYLISKEICPEDVGRFSAINKVTQSIAKSAAFWKCLYSRYYKICNKVGINLPERLQPRAISRLYGLRTCVIKSLFYLYPPFIQRAKIPPGVQLVSKSISRLYRSVCSNVWHEQTETTEPTTKRQCTFYFQFTAIDTNNAVTNQQHHKDKFEYLDDICANKQEDCFVLKAVLSQYTHLPFVLGWRLSELSLSLSQDMRSHRLKLTFQSFLGKKSSGVASLGSSVCLLLDGVQSVTVLDWWHPDYPLAVI